jgi:phosphoribosyl-ATP pyrophosphohydrolase/phosphoribosyl-AMP cyclohydrolase
LHFTSGTTGEPKGAVHVHQAVEYHKTSGQMALVFKANDIFWCTADPGWVTGTSYGIISELENTIRERWVSESTDSYVAALKANGTHKIAQKVGEEAVEVVIEALRNDDHLFLEESADLLFHYLLLLKAKGYQLDDVLKVLIARRK